MHSLLQVQWRVTPLKLPRPWLPCARCDARRPFVCSGKFRVNAQKKRIDAWLIYRCAHCEQNWNFPVLERCPVNAIEPALLRALTESDAALARHHAFDLVRLGRYSLEIEAFPELQVEKRLLSSVAAEAGRAEIEILAASALGIRLDRLLAVELGLSRGRIERLERRGALSVSPNVNRTLSQVARNGQRIRIELDGLSAEPGLLERLTGKEVKAGPA